MGQKRAIIDAAMPRMDKAFAHFESEIAAIKAGKASPNVLNGVMVESYGAQMPVNQVASVTVPDARTILIQPWDKNLLAPIEKAIINSNLGMTPSNNGETIRLNVPPLTEERRKELMKQIKAEAETCRVALRGVRRDAIEAIKKAVKADGLPEDVAKDGEDEVQKIVDGFSKRIDEVLTVKEKEIMTV
ncbi:ribosome recycling factor [uncultured Rikenella sp.]|uniref:ribosome recycling factor n=1 Tax=uncultured Rikenella sp. TaxID=368003 RepID=UPI0025D13C69|nr:ribosome recycling factor [uncultured Rikenella sp.]